MAFSADAAMRAEEAMAAIRPLLVVHDAKEGHLVYDLRLMSDPTPELRDTNEQTPLELRITPVWTLELRPLPFPAVPPLHYRPLAVAGGNLVGVARAADDPRTPRAPHSPGPLFRRASDGVPAGHRCVGYLVDSGARDPGPPIMVPVGDDTVIRMDTVIYGDTSRFEALRRVPGGGGCWRTDPLPRPPPTRHMRPFDSAPITAHFAMGTRVWISVAGMGTFSLDTEMGTWQVQSLAELPLEGRALFVPELGTLVGFKAGTRQLCTCEFSHGFPALKRTWSEADTWEWKDYGFYDPSTEMASLAYLGQGRVCVCRAVKLTAQHRSLPIHCPNPIYFNYWGCFLVLELTRAPGEGLQLTKRWESSFHGEWTQGECRDIYLLQPAISA
ncbi:hypothetical protein ACP70R_020986 [Stipagrostis hirtigluma subsp. patula]